MKNTSVIYSTLALLSAAFMPDAAAQDASYLDFLRWQQEPVSIVTEESAKGGSGAKQAELRFTIDWNGLQVAPQQTAAIVPVLVTADGSQTYSFAPVFIDGRTRAKAVDRMEVLSGIGRPEGSTVVRPYEKDTPAQIEYVSSIAYDPAMLDGRIVFYETVSGCAGCIEGEDSLSVGDVLPRYVPDWRFSATPAGGVKQREIRERADLKFKVNLHGIDPAFADNASVLDKVMSSMRMAADSSIYTVTAVRFIGYASPDGPEQFNRELALRRANSLADYVKSSGEAVSGSLFTVESVGEDWEGLFAAAAADPQIAGNATLDKVRGMLTEGNWAECERLLKSDPGLYGHLREKVLPSLRRTEYSIEYNIRQFSAEEAAQLWSSRPELLSVDEFKAAAGLCGKDSPEYLEILLTAARTYPDDPAALNTAATALYEAGRLAEAGKLLEGRGEPLLQNTLGVIRAGEGDYDAAMQLFESASDSGNSEAAHNLAELENVMYQLEQ